MDTDPTSELAEAFAYFVRQAVEAEQALRNVDAAGDSLSAARGYLHLGRQVLSAMENHLLADPDLPRFRILDDRVRTGGDNPDQRYGFAPIHGGVDYEVWGSKGSASRLEVQLYRREPYGAEDVSLGYLADEDIDFAADGSFSIRVGPGRSGRSALDNPSEATILQVRQIYGDWSEVDCGSVFIDRVGSEGAAVTVESAEVVARRWRGAADDLRASATCWPELVQNGIEAARPVNTLLPLRTPAAKGGVLGRWISLGQYEIDGDHALLITMPPTAARYQGAQLADRWFASLEYSSATSSLSGEQALVAPDQNRYLVVALNDPGYANWLDPTGLARGVVHLRYDGLAEAPEPEQHPTARLVSVAELPEVIPGFANCVVTPADRDDQRAARRRHVRRRFGR
jgi:hypothetical protein